VHLEKYPESSRERFLSVAEIERLGSVLSEAERVGSESSSAIAAVRLLLLTGCRVGEILRLRWHDIDFELAVLRLQDTKTGPQTRPLGAAALRFLDTLPRENEWVIPGRDPGAPLVNLAKPWGRIRKRAGIPDARLHDLRHTLGSHAAHIGIHARLIRDLLGHRSMATTERYLNTSADPRRAAADRVSSRIAAALEGRSDATVIP